MANIKHFIFGLLIVSGFVLAIYEPLKELGGSEVYNVPVQDLTNTFSKVDEIYQDFNKTKTGLEGITTSKQENLAFFTGVADLFGNTKDIIFGTTAGIAGSLTLGFDILKDFTLIIGGYFPDWLFPLLGAMLTVLVVMMAVRALRGKD